MKNASCQSILDRLLDVLIPAQEARGIPAAGGLGVAAFVLAQPQAAGEIGAVLARAQVLESAGQPIDADLAAQLEADLPKAFAMLVRLTYMGYYSRADVRRLLGLSAAPVHPNGYDVAAESEALLASLTAPVTARGRQFREA